jgi:hypothetical protein
MARPSQAGSRAALAGWVCRERHWRASELRQPAWQAASALRILRSTRMHRSAAGSHATRGVRQTTMSCERCCAACRHDHENPSPSQSHAAAAHSLTAEGGTRRAISGQLIASGSYSPSQRPRARLRSIAWCSRDTFVRRYVPLVYSRCSVSCCTQPVPPVRNARWESLPAAPAARSARLTRTYTDIAVASAISYVSACLRKRCFRHDARVPAARKPSRAREWFPCLTRPARTPAAR